MKRNKFSTPEVTTYRKRQKQRGKCNVESSLMSESIPRLHITGGRCTRIINGWLRGVALNSSSYYGIVQ